MIRTRYSPETQLLMGLFVLLVPLLLAGLVVLPAGAQCSVRADWPIYVVAQGDTLFSIARRFNTTVGELTQANCLNTNRILVGQQLRVPPGASTATSTSIPGFSGELPSRSDFSFIVAATFQQFENGFMTWRADSGVIWAFFNSGRVTSFALEKYGGLSGDRRYLGPIPAGRRFPSGGFKKVYDNFPGVQIGVGWAIGGEQGYDMSLQNPSFGSFFTITIPDKRYIRINPDGTWVFTEAVIVNNPTPAASQRTTGATFQPFEHGFMVWRADTGEIRVYTGEDSGELVTFAHREYASLPIRTDLIQESVGNVYRFPPIFGFGRVWSSMSGVRERIGWPTGSEVGYTMLFQDTVVSSTTAFSLPDGRFVTHTQGNTWVVGAETVKPS